MPPRPLLIALAVSLLLHVCTLGAGTFMALLQRPPPRVLQVSLKSAQTPPVDIPPAEPLVKNTLDREETKPEPKPPEPEIKPAPDRNTPKPAPRPAKAEKREVQAAQRKIAEHTYYPPEAISGGIEGDVRLLLVLNEDGAISDVQIAASSGHAMLDNAAIKAAYAMGRLSGVTARQMILPVSFRLR
jgi:protein TonB